MPAPRMGWNSQFGMIDEVTYGTPVTVTKFLEMVSASPKLDIETIESKGLRSGRLNQSRAGNYARWRKGGMGDVEFEVQNKGYGLLLKHLLGSIATTGPVATTAYTHTATVGSLVGKFFTAQISRDSQPHTYEGCKVDSWDMSVSTGGLLMLKASIDAEDENTSTALATASYGTNLVPFNFLQGVLTVGGTSTDVSDFTLSGKNNLKTDRYFIRGSGLKKEPIDQGREYTGSITLEYEDQVMYDRFKNATEAQLILTFTGGVISGAENYKIVITAPVVRFDGETPPVAGSNVIELTAPFRILDDSLSIAYETTDVTP